MDLSFLKQALPTIATALGGPLAGIAAGFIADKLGVSDKTIANVSDVINKATQSPETMLQLKQLDAELAKYFAQLEVDVFKAEVADRDSARSREVQLKDNTPKILAYGITAGFFGAFGYLIRYGFPEGNEAIITYMLGSLGTGWTTIMAYYFGSTKGSSDKTAVMTATINGKEK